MVQIFSIITIAAVALFSMTGAQQSYNQKTCLYSGRSGVGEYICFAENYIPQLQNNNFDNKAYSFCANGVYLYYDFPNYNDGMNALMEYAFGPDNYCGDFQNLGGKLTSFRYAGDPKNYRTDSLTLYVGTYFQGEEEYLLRDASNLNLDLQASSLIVTGVSPWTLYDRQNYGGNSICVYPPKSDNHTPALVYDTNTISVPSGTIRSARKGCYGKKRTFVTALASRGSNNVTGLPLPLAPHVDPTPVELNPVPFVKESLWWGNNEEN